ncbi:Uncharacterized conserved protein, DUF58 family, contains vWF domain [Thermomonospora echinospora]|uniref:Uncharacterized conserved protein, DUF58 family, contains vWF domain n=1 Tax=Thermomonospora echinospora TaxID=1992 RepID=A0A1H5SKJ0_9ACTN|nr:DUF58 domain-containing protein [Thermomonospora echinospora]SEF51106.1 Uncharacterized conserved protein, DUF58 family, contains vWF domain [Thermomonospora echinospora]
MKRTLGGLTTRGRSFVAAGVTAIVCAFALGERDLLRAGVLVLALPLLSSLVVSRTRYRLACARRLDPPRLSVGHEARVDLRLENVSRLPGGLLLVEDRVPYTLGGRARFVLDRIEPHGSRELSYRVRSDVRGRYQVGPLTVRLADPFGLVELVRSFSLADRLTVTPPLVELPPGRLMGGWTGGGDSLARTVANAGEDDVAPREYRHGDDLRRVHWRATARRGELMVRREERHWQSSGTLFLDTRRHAYAGEGPAGSFEQAVSIAASLGVHLSRAGMGLRFVTDAGQVLSPSAAFEGALLDALAVVHPSTVRSLTPGLAAMGGAAGPGREGEGLVIAVFGVLDAQEAQALAAARRGTSTYVAILVDPRADPAAGGGAGGGTGRTARLLRAAGWRVAVVGSAAGLAAAWTAADQAAEESARGRS